MESQKAKPPLRSTRMRVYRRIQHKLCEVCFFCWQRIRNIAAADWHHPYPKRFAGEPGYPWYMPLVHVHRNCHRRWHGLFDPCSWTARIHDFQHYLSQAQGVRFGWGILRPQPHRATDLYILPALAAPLREGIIPFVAQRLHQQPKHERPGAAIAAPYSLIYTFYLV